MSTIGIDKTVEMIIAACDSIIANKDLLTEVDSKIGDGDHGIGMSGGMEKAKEELLEKAPFEDINTVFKTAGMAMLNSMGRCIRSNIRFALSWRNKKDGKNN